MKYWIYISLNIIIYNTKSSSASYTGNDRFHLGHSGLTFKNLDNVFEVEAYMIQVIKVQKSQTPDIIFPFDKYPRTLRITQSVMQSFERLIMEGLQSKSIHRTKREQSNTNHGLLPIFGWIQSKLIDVATEADLDDLRIQSTSFSHYFEGLRNISTKRGTLLKNLLADTNILQHHVS